MIDYSREQLDYLFRNLDKTTAERLAAMFVRVHILLTKEQWMAYVGVKIPEDQTPVAITKKGAVLYSDERI